MPAKIKTVIHLILIPFYLSLEALADDESIDYDSEELTTDLSNNSFSGWLINQRGCRLPDLKVHNDDVMKYYGKEPNFNCHSSIFSSSPLFTEDTRFLNFNISALRFFESKNISCLYYSFERVEGAEDKVKYSCPRPLKLDAPNEITDEFIRVTCNDTDNGQLIYKDYFAFLPLKAETEKRCEEVNAKNATEEPSLNTLIIGLDTISRLQFHRHFLRSATFMKENLDAIEMLGYHIVAENTFPNLASLLTGLSADQLDRVCLRRNKQLMDSCPLIWNKFHSKGFRTIFVEDAPAVAIFNYGAKGFQRQPTDYYVRPMYLEYEDDVGFDNIGCGYRCLGPRSSLSFLLNHAEKTARVFKDKKYFGFHWSCSATHDTFNIPTTVDDTVYQFLETLKRENLLNNTLLVLMADHGPRILSRTTFINSKQGFYEKRLPLMMLVFPDWFKERYPVAISNLRRNAHMLTTVYDLHHTLHDLMNLNTLESETLQKRFDKERGVEDAQGRSLFLPISTNRNCYQARIPSEHCACPGYFMRTNPVSLPETETSSEIHSDNCLLS